MPEQQRPVKFTNVIAGAIGSVLAAVVLSKFGVAGTLTGAVLGSVVSTIGTQVNEHYLERSSQKLKQLREVQGRAMAAAREVAEAKGAPAQPGPSPRPAGPPAWLGWLGWTRWLSWKRVALLGAGGFLAAMLAITGIELAAGRPLADLVGGGHSGRSTTLGQVTEGGTRATAPTSSSGTQTTGAGTSSSSTQGPTTTVPVTTVAPAPGPPSRTTAPAAPTRTTAG